MTERRAATGIIDLGDRQSIEATLVHRLEPGDKVRIALRPENVALGRQDAVNSFAARVLERRYLGTQTVYDIDFAGRRLEALELGTAARHAAGSEITVSLPAAGLWAYRDQGPIAAD